MTPAVSVVVPTRDRPESLARCLAALQRQTIRASLEIVVVDDGSRRRDALVAAAAATRPRVLHQLASGPAAARNAGARASRAPLVCFTDDDCRPEPDWAERLARALHGADAAAGATVNGRPHDRLAEASELIHGYLSRRAVGADARTTFAPSNNIACRKEVLAAVPFDERFRSAAGEDRDWCARLVALGFRFVAEPGAVVLHDQRFDVLSFLHKHARYGAAARRFRQQHCSSRLEAPDFYAGLVQAGFERGHAVGALVCLAQAATAAGFFTQALADRRAER